MTKREMGVDIITINNATEVDVHRWVTEASDLGLRPGEWPQLLRTNLGNGQPFVLYHHEVRDGDLLWSSYLQGNGCLNLRVFND